MRAYGNTYNGKIHTFILVDIYMENGFRVLELVNNETMRKTKINADYLDAKDGIVRVGDTITRQYVREGLGLYGSEGGGYSSNANTYYTNVSSDKRWAEEHPLRRYAGGIFAVVLLLVVLAIIGMV